MRKSNGSPSVQFVIETVIESGRIWAKRCKTRVSVSVSDGRN